MKIFLKAINDEEEKFFKKFIQIALCVAYLCEGQLFGVGTTFADTLLDNSHCKLLMSDA